MAPLLTIEETPKALHISQRGVYRLVFTGQLATVQVGASTRVRPSAVDRFVDRNVGYAGEGKRRYPSRATDPAARGGRIPDPPMLAAQSLRLECQKSEGS